MLFLPDRVLIVKLFYKNGESPTVTLRKFRTEKGLKTQKSPFSLNGIFNLVRGFEVRSFITRLILEIRYI